MSASHDSKDSEREPTTLKVKKGVSSHLSMNVQDNKGESKAIDLPLIHKKS